MNEPLVLVTWIDSGMYVGIGWASAEEYRDKILDPGNLKVTTVGYLLHEDYDTVIVVQSRDTYNGTYLNGQVILRQNIQSIEKLTTIVTSDDEPAWMY